MRLLLFKQLSKNYGQILEFEEYSNYNQIITLIPNLPRFIKHMNFRQIELKEF